MNKQHLMRWYYVLKPYIPRRLQIEIRHRIAIQKREKHRDVWPIDYAGYKQPLFWQGWPDNKKFALILTHDVDTARGLQRVPDLVQLEKRLGFRSAFYVVPERYDVNTENLHHLIRDGFEVGVHGLKHDGKLFQDYSTFAERAIKINNYLVKWNASGFRAPCMHHNLDWLHDLNIHYDASTFDTDPFEPQSDGVGTIFPFVVNALATGHYYIELPYTLPQDCTLFVILKEKTIDVWKRKLNWIAQKGGTALVITHPDYMKFHGTNYKTDEYPAAFYEDFLTYIQQHFQGQYWSVLPKDLASFWLKRWAHKEEHKVAV